MLGTFHTDVVLDVVDFQRWGIRGVHVRGRGDVFVTSDIDVVLNVGDTSPWTIRGTGVCGRGMVVHASRVGAARDEVDSRPVDGIRDPGISLPLAAATEVCAGEVE